MNRFNLETPNRLALLRGERRYYPVNLRGFELSWAEERALKSIHSAIWSVDPTRGSDVMAAEDDKLQSADARYLLSAMKIELGHRLKDRKLQAKGTDEVLASGKAPNWALDELYRNQAVFALEAGNLFKAETALERYRAHSSNDAQAVASLAIFKANVGKFEEAVPLFEEAISLRSREGKKVPALWQRTAEISRQRI